MKIIMGSDDLNVQSRASSFSGKELKSEEDISSEGAASVEAKVVYQGWLDKRGEYINHINAII